MTGYYINQSIKIAKSGSNLFFYFTSSQALMRSRNLRENAKYIPYEVISSLQ